MARFDVHQVRGGLALDCQADALRYLPTRFVIPLEPPHPALVIDARFNPQFSLSGEQFVLVPQLAGTIRLRDMGAMIGSLGSDNDQLAVQRAIDMLTGSY